MFSEVKYQARMHPLSSTSPAALFVQALPLVLLYPLRRVLTWITFVAYWIIIQRFSSLSRLQALLSALALERFTAGVLLPLVAVLAKWTVIGRYKAGAHQLWGSYYLRWWIVDQTLQVCGRGVFRHSGRSLIWYYRLLGAKIGRDVSIHPSARFAEHDLLTIGDGSAIDNVSVRAFTLGAGAMRLEPLTLGKSVTVAAKVALVPGMPVPDYSVLAPLSSSYDLPAPARTDLPPRLPPPGLPAGAGQCTMRFPAPGIGYRALGYAILLGVCLLEQLPVLLVLRAMVDSPWYIPHLSNVREVIVWFLTPQRIGYYLALRVVRAVVLPIVRLGACIAVKRLIIGKFTEGRRDRSEWNLFKHWLMASLLPGEALQDVGHLVGAHYEGMTLILRLLGAKVGERVYWPGSSFEGLVEYDLLEVGDDCVFGSRSIIRCADATHAARVTVCKGANVGDRCVLLPGSTVGVNAVLGSGGILQKGSVMAPGSMHVGSYRGRAVVLDEGDVAAADAPTLKPFGSAFYLGNAPYFVIPGWMHGLIGALARSWAVVHRALTLSLSLFATASLLGGVESPDFLGASRLALFVRFLLMFIVIQNAATVVAVGAAIVLKWGLMGRRTVGDHSWDRSPFCQRWQVYLASTVIIRHAYYGRGILEYLHGSAYLVWYFRALGCHIGRDVCLYPTGADPMMTEPDLVQIGDEACVDDASLIAHINSRGRFSLNRVVVGPGATLRAFSRLLSGAAMMPRATVLEHTLVLGGDVVDEDSIWQGWPGREIAKATPVQVQVPSDGGAVRDVGVKGEEIWATLPMRWLGRSRRRARATPSARWARLVQAGDGNAAQLDDIGWGREVR